MAQTQNHPLAQLATDVFAALFARSQSHRAHLADDTARWFNNHVCKNEEKLLERLDQAILDVIDNPEKTQQTTAIGTLF
jgi:hypothetical protein